MKSPREIKEDKVTFFEEQVKESQAMVLADYKGLTVHAMEELRGKVREIGGRVAIIKNTLARVALKNAGIEGLDEDLTGQMAFVFSHEDAVSGPKVANDFSRENESFKLVSGYYDGKRLSIDEVKALASTPSKDELRSTLVGLLMAPLADLVGTMNATLQEFVGTLDAKAAEMEG